MPFTTLPTCLLPETWMCLHTGIFVALNQLNTYVHVRIMCKAICDLTCENQPLSGNYTELCFR